MTSQYFIWSPEGIKPNGVPMSQTHKVPLFGHFNSCTNEPSNRNKSLYPYSYDPVVVFVKEMAPTGNAYDDRMQGWDHTKFAKSCEIAWDEQRVSVKGHDPEGVQRFLREYWNNPRLVLVLIIEYCNVATGYPCFYFAWNDEGESQEKTS